MSDDPNYEKNWPKLTIEWGQAKIAAWHRELEAQPAPTKARQDELNKDIEYMGRLLERVKNR
jgi:hypothetical protein